MRRRAFRAQPLVAFMFVVCVVGTTAERADASPTGLNNIITADTPGDRQIVFQAFYTTDGEKQDDLWIAFKGGLHFNLDELAVLRFEYGLDSRIADSDAGPTVAQFKLAGDLGAGLPALAVGVANIAFSDSERDDAGQVFPYAVVSHDFKFIRLHAGYGVASDNQAAFFGADRSFDLGATRFTPRFDITQINDEDQWLGSAGFIWEFTRRFAVEFWVSQPFDTGDTTFTFKLDLGFRF